MTVPLHRLPYERALLPLRDVVASWRPGSPGTHDQAWGWSEEAYDLWTREPQQMSKLLNSVADVGILDPVLLGHDGRVWDGHHRIVVASALMLPDIPALVVTPKPCRGESQ